MKKVASFFYGINSYLGDYFYSICRPIKHFIQNRERGWLNQDLWFLDYTISKFTLPHLRAFKDYQKGYPQGMTQEKWKEMIDDMIFFHERVVSMDISYWNNKSADYQRYRRGKYYFFKHYENLWS